MTIFHEYRQALLRSEGKSDSERFLEGLERILDRSRREPPRRVGFRRNRLLARIRQQIERGDCPESARSCPECSRRMIVLRINGNDIDHCRTCRSFWFDENELRTLTGLPCDIPGERLHHRTSQRRCPVCGEVMCEYQFSPVTNLMVDRCPARHGVYLQECELRRAFEVAASRAAQACAEEHTSVNGRARQYGGTAHSVRHSVAEMFLGGSGI